MKINFIVKLSIIFCATTLMAAEKNQIIKKVVAYTKGQEIPTVEYVLNTFEDTRLKIDKNVIERFKNKPEKVKTYEGVEKAPSYKFDQLYTWESLCLNEIRAYYKYKDKNKAYYEQRTTIL